MLIVVLNQIYEVRNDCKRQRFYWNPAFIDDYLTFSRGLWPQMDERKLVM